MSAGRPTEFTQEKADKICERLIEGESLRTICADEEMPSKSAVFSWLNKFPEFADQYARAREMQADSIFDDILQIADDGSNDWMEKQQGDNIGWVTNGEALQRSRLRVDARKWMAGKLKPKKYGERLELDNNLNVSDPLMDLFKAVAENGKRLAHDSDD